MYIKKWQKLELSIRSLVSEQFGESEANRTFSLLISKLLTEKVLDETDEQKIRRFLSIRNDILHEGYKLSSTNYEITTRDIDKLLSKLRSS
jgi:uncharacterized protein YutE (UPF0331/DUF86 family)